MPRPKKCRLVENFPQITIFKPGGVSLLGLEHIILGFEELEAIRLADFEGKKQEEAALIMDVSRATFGRIIEKARYIVADALLNSKAIVIQGGDFCCKNISSNSFSIELNKFIEEKQKKCLNCKKYKLINKISSEAEENIINN